MAISSGRTDLILVAKGSSRRFLLERDCTRLCSVQLTQEDQRDWSSHCIARILCWCILMALGALVWIVNLPKATWLALAHQVLHSQRKIRQNTIFRLETWGHKFFYFLVISEWKSKDNFDKYHDHVLGDHWNGFIGASACSLCPSGSFSATAGHQMFSCIVLYLL